jgi:nucleotide-binding universal stress UspA family protein
VHILITTAGALPASRVADLVATMTREDLRVSVMTVIEVPLSFLDDLEDGEWRPFDDDIDEATVREQLVHRYVEERGARLVEPVIAALRTHGIEARTILEEGDSPGEVIVRIAAEQKADMIVMGSTRPIFDETVWSSVSVKVMQLSTIPLVLVPGVSRTFDDVERDERRRVISEQMPSSQGTATSTSAPQ